MATAREIRRRIRSVKNISKVTGALEAVSASKVRRAQNAATASRAYSNAAFEVLTDLGRLQGGELSHPLLDEPEKIEHILVILITSDRGLAGPYNTNILKVALEFEKQQDVPVSYLTVGKKGRDLLLRRGRNIIAEFTNMPDPPAVSDVTPVTRAAKDEFFAGRVDEVYVAYTNFINTLQQEPTIERMLPLRPGESEITAGGQESAGSREAEAVYTFEPSVDLILDEILPRFSELVLYQAILESLASEHSARMVAMRNATENANVLVDDLTLDYNKARQLAITSEILDIVGGAEALAQSSE
jgi:F-type H+-transporting ATPase subunit gamma